MFPSVAFKNLTEFNTAHNRRVISVADMPDVPNPLKRKHRDSRVGFAEEEDVINPGVLLTEPILGLITLIDESYNLTHSCACIILLLIEHQK